MKILTNMKILAGIWITATLMLSSGCQPQKEGDPVQVPGTSVKTSEKPNQDSEPPKPQKEVLLSAPEFPGQISFSSADILRTGNGFHLPVYLKNVTKDDIVDTITVTVTLPEEIRLQEVITPTGFTAQLDGIEGGSPVVYYHPFSITAGSYSPVVAKAEPIFTLIFSGELREPLLLEGSFFQTSGNLLRTGNASLAP